MKSIALVTVFAAVAASGLAHAQLLGTPTVTPTDNDGIGYTVSSTDLIEGLTPTLGSGSATMDGTTDSGYGVSVLTNGGFGDQGVSTGQATLGAGDVLTYAVSAGQVITSIETYAGGDSFRGSQAYTISYSLNNGGSYATLATVNFYNPITGYGNSSDEDSKVEIDGFTLTGATNLKFSFAAVPDYGSDYNRYRELDVEGHAVVPEPGTDALLFLGCGSLALMLGARRVRRA